MAKTQTTGRMPQMLPHEVQCNVPLDALNRDTLATAPTVPDCKTTSLRKLDGCKAD